MSDHLNRAEAEVSLRRFDHLELGGASDPEPTLRLLGQCPVVHSDAYGGFWVITDHAMLVEAARDHETFSASRKKGSSNSFPYSFPVSGSMIESDPPEHRALRGPLQRRFRRAAMEEMTPVIRDFVSDLIDAFIESGQADFSTQLTGVLPALVTAKLLDIPPESQGDFRAWARESVALGPNSPGFNLLMALINDLYETRKADPGDDMLSEALSFEINGEPITKDDWVSLVLLLVLAGLDTTSNAAALMLHYMAVERPEIKPHLVEHPEELEVSIEELLRLLSPVPQHPRRLQRDADLGGKGLKKGDVVELHWWSGNRDEKVFPDPAEYQPHRHPNPHVAFGTGPHTCLGAHLARVELRVLLGEVLRRMPDYKVIAEGVQRYPSLNRGMSNLPVTFTPGPRERAADPDPVSANRP